MVRFTNVKSFFQIITSFIKSVVFYNTGQCFPTVLNLIFFESMATCILQNVIPIGNMEGAILDLQSLKYLFVSLRK